MIRSGVGGGCGGEASEGAREHEEGRYPVIGN